MNMKPKTLTLGLVLALSMAMVSPQSQAQDLDFGEGAVGSELRVEPKPKPTASKLVQETLESPEAKATETTKSLVDKSTVSLENEKVQVPKPKTGNAISGLEIDKEGSPLRVKVQLPDGKDVMLEFDRVQLANKLDNFSQTELKFYKFHEVPAVEVLGQLARAMKRNFEPAPGMTETVTATYYDMTPLQVFERVASLQGLIVRDDGKTLRLIDMNKIKITDMVTRTYRLKNVNIYNYLDTIRALMSPMGRMALNTMNHQGKLDIKSDGSTTTAIEVGKLYGPINSGSARAKSIGGGSDSGNNVTVNSDKDSSDAVLPNNTFSVTIMDIPEVQQKIAKYLAEVDVPSKQIHVQMRLYLFDDSPTLRFGADWSSLLNQYAISTNFPDSTLNLFRTGAFQGLAPNAVLIRPSNFSIVLSYFQTQGKGKQITAPNTIAQHGQTAMMRSVRQIPIPGPTTVSNDTGVSQRAAPEFINVGTTLNVTPFILDDSSPNPRDWEIYLDMRPEISSVASNTVIDGNIIPVIQAVAPTTSVRIKNGDTVLIGGLTDSAFTRNFTGPPFLENVPVLNWIFGSTSRTNSKRELVILATATVIDPGTKVAPLITGKELASQLVNDTATELWEKVPENAALSTTVVTTKEGRDRQRELYAAQARKKEAAEKKRKEMERLKADYERELEELKRLESNLQTY
jgi:type II secretory pathway component GspD/PulD (secretin)